ncbi:acylphosphatase [candidate division KSB1 bacterium]|nr:acylphosphatase [candidate division KSB1 bacterium]
MEFVRVKIVVHGDVQGVGFRYFACAQAGRLNLKGYVRNLPNYCVETEVEGLKDDVEAYIESLRQGPPLSQVTKMEVSSQTYSNEFTDFHIRH